MDKIQNIQETDVKIVDKALTSLGERRKLTKDEQGIKQNLDDFLELLQDK